MHSVKGSRLFTSDHKLLRGEAVSQLVEQSSTNLIIIVVVVVFLNYQDVLTLILVRI